VRSGGSVLLIALDDCLTYRCGKGGALSLQYKPDRKELAKGDALRFQVGFAGAGSGTKTAKMLDFARQFGIASPGEPRYAPQVTRGKPLDTYLVWRLDAQGAGIEAKVPKAAVPGFLPVCVEGLNDGWSVFLLDRNRKGPRFRGLPTRDGRAYAQLDLADGHPPPPLRRRRPRPCRRNRCPGPPRPTPRHRRRLRPGARPGDRRARGASPLWSAAAELPLLWGRRRGRRGEKR
jgi:hypothetical protein